MTQSTFSLSLARLSALLLSPLLLAVSANCQAGEVDQIFVRAKGGPSFYTGLDPVSSAFGVGLDLGFRTASGFGVTVMSELNLSTSGYDSSIQNTSLTRYVKTLFIGAAPSYSVAHGPVTLSLGLGVGALMLTTSTYTSVGGSNPVNSYSPERTESRFALAPQFSLDIDLFGGAFASVGLQYITALGSSPRPSIFTPSLGFGYRF